MSGLEIHANIIHTLLSRSHIRPANRILAMLLLLLFAVAASVLTTLLRPATVIVLSLVAIPVVLLPLSYAALTQLGLWVDFATPLLVTSWGALATEYRDSRQIRKSLGEYVGWEVADQIVHQDADLRTWRLSRYSAANPPQLVTKSGVTKSTHIPSCVSAA